MTIQSIVVVIDMANAIVIPNGVLRSAKGKDIDTVLQMNSYSWAAKEKDIKASDLKVISLELQVNTDIIHGAVIKNSHR